MAFDTKMCKGLLRQAPRHAAGTHGQGAATPTTLTPTNTPQPSYRTPMRYPWWGSGGNPSVYGPARCKGVPPVPATNVCRGGGMWPPAGARRVEPHATPVIPRAPTVILSEVEGPPSSQTHPPSPSHQPQRMRDHNGQPILLAPDSINRHPSANPG